MKGDDPVTQEQFDAMMENWMARRAQEPATMPELLAEAREMGLTDGFRPRGLMTREEGAVMARAAVRAALEGKRG